MLPIPRNTGRWTIGNGTTINAWSENWLGKEYCLNNRNITILENLFGARVCDLVDEHGAWNIDILHDWIPAYWIDKLRYCVPP